MPRQAPILSPDLVRVTNNLFIQKPVVGDSANTFLANRLLTITTGVLVLVATGGILVYGLTPDGSKTATQLPPDILPRPVGEGENHWLFSLMDAEIEINVGALSTNALVIGAGAQQPSGVVIGGQYGIATATAGAYSGQQFLDPTNTTNKLFQVTAFIDGVLTDDYNGRVRCKILPSTIQN